PRKRLPSHGCDGTLAYAREWHLRLRFFPFAHFQFALFQKANSGRCAMTIDFSRRDALKISAGAALAAAGGFSCVELARAAPIEVPTIDRLSVRVLVDSASDIFFRPQEVSGVKTEAGRSVDAKRPLHSEWGLSLYVEPQRGEE